MKAILKPLSQRRMGMSGKSQPTIYDISERAGVSIATVSRVINGNTNVNPETKKRVLKVMDECGYTPNAFARGLGLNTMKTIGILCADSSDIYLAKAVYFVEQRLRAKGYDTLLCCTGYELENKKSAVNLLISKKVDAVVLIGSNFLEENDDNNQYIKDAAASVPVMLLNASYEYNNVYSIFCDDFGSMASVAGRLLDDGRKNILYLYNSHSYSSIKKLNGFKSAFETRNIPLSKKQLQFCSCTREDINGIAKFVENVFKSSPGFDAIVGSEDSLAAGALKYIKKAGFAIPKDVAIVGYNNSIMTTLCDPELSSVDNKLEILCEQLVFIMMGVLEGKDMPKKTEYSGELVLRETL